MKRSVSGVTTPNIWNITDASPVLETYADQPFDTSDNQTWLQGDPDSGAFCRRDVCSVAAGVLTVPTLTNFDTTEDSPNNQTATYSTYIRATNQQLIPWLLNYRIPVGTLPISWDTLRIHKNGILQRDPLLTYTRQEILALIEQQIDIAVGDLNFAAVGVLGRIETATVPADLSHPKAVLTEDRRITSCIYNVKSYGALGDGGTNDRVAIQAAINAAIADTAGHVEFPPGTYVKGAGGPLVILQAKGVGFHGAGPDNTKIVATDGSPAVQCNGLWRALFEGIQFKTNAAIANGAVFELDGNYDGVHAQGVQGNRFESVFFDASNLAKYALAICRQGGSSGQGSENVFVNNNFQSALRAGTFWTGYNALNNLFDGGNWQDMPKYGVEGVAGSATFIKPAFQSLVGLVDAIANGSYDFNLGSAGTGERITILDADSESPLFLVSLGPQTIRVIGLCNRHYGNNWTALTSLALKFEYAGTTATGNQKMFKVTTAGITGAAEPTWPESGTVVDGTVTWTQVDYNQMDVVSSHIEDCLFGRGAQIKTSVSRDNFITANRFTRRDYQAAGSAEYGFFHENHALIGGDLIALDAFSANRKAPAALSTDATVDITATLQTGNIIPYTPTQAATINAVSTPTRDQEFQLVITTSGASSFNITFGTNFKSQGVLATGTVSGKVFVIKFVSDGVNYNEVSRTPAM